MYSRSALRPYKLFNAKLAGAGVDRPAICGGQNCQIPVNAKIPDTHRVPGLSISAFDRSFVNDQPLNGLLIVGTDTYELDILGVRRISIDHGQTIADTISC